MGVMTTSITGQVAVSHQVFRRPRENFLTRSRNWRLTLFIVPGGAEYFDKCLGLEKFVGQVNYFTWTPDQVPG